MAPRRQGGGSVNKPTDLNITELAQLSMAITNDADALDDAQIERVCSWANDVRYRALVLERVLAGEVAVTVPANPAAPLHFALSEKGRDKAKTAIADVFYKLAQTIDEAEKRIATQSRQVARKFDPTTFLRDLLTEVLGSQTVETIQADSKKER